MISFVYIHGFNSGYDPENEKIKTLEKIGDVSGITYNSCSAYNMILEYLSDKIEYTDNLVMIGTSLGGYWAAKMAIKLKCPSVIINPCHDPATMLRKYEDISMENYKTSRTEYLSSSTVDSYIGKQLTGEEEGFHYKPLVLLDRGDEVISCIKSEVVLEGFPMKIFKNGCHRFAHMEESLEEIQSYVRICKNRD
jgi:predicted esterase YcpF (UPF0227 family)